MMTKEELRDYCYSIGLIDTKFSIAVDSKYTMGYRYDGEFVDPMDFMVGWDEEKQCAVVAKSCIIDEDFVGIGPIRMIGIIHIQNDEEIKARIAELIKTVQENIKFLKWKEMKKKIRKMEGDFE